MAGAVAVDVVIAVGVRADGGAALGEAGDGVDLALARVVSARGEVEPVVARVPLADAQERLRELLDRKWEAGAGASAAA